MARSEFSRKTKREALERSGFKCEAVGRTFICHTCSIPFDRSYNITAKRASDPQFCSTACYSMAQKQRAEVRLQSRFWSRVHIRSEDECWEWQGRRNKANYGVFDLNNRPHIASRMAYRLTHGEIAPMMLVCHACDNPPCVNPKHLWLGTDHDNSMDSGRKGRKPGNGLRGSAVNHSRLSMDQAREIKKSSESAKVLAARFGVSGTAIRKIWNGENWGWLDA